VMEFPVTNFRVPMQAGYKPLEIGAVSVSETIATIEALQASGCRDVVISLHSFSFLKNLRNRSAACQPDRLVISRFRKLCRELSMRSQDIEVRTMGDMERFEPPLAESSVIPNLGWSRPLARKVAQGLNRLSPV
jgi:hypothetical protein